MPPGRFRAGGGSLPTDGDAALSIKFSVMRGLDPRIRITSENSQLGMAGSSPAMTMGWHGTAASGVPAARYRGPRRRFSASSSADSSKDTRMR